jgi:ketosteroid isomerase-like protein
MPILPRPRVIPWLLIMVTAAPAAGQGPPCGTLLEADAAAGTAVAAAGLRGLSSLLADDAALLLSGAPVVNGAGVAGFLTSQPGLDSLRVQWEPLEARSSAAADFGITWGVTAVSRHGADEAPRLGRYLSAWRCQSGRWRLAALALLGAIPPASVRSTGLPRSLPALRASGSTAAFVQADLDFAADARRLGPATAFRNWAAPTVITFGGPDINRGPQAVEASIAAVPPMDWEWHPVLAYAAAAGDLGATVGEAVLTPKGEGDPSYTKYLTLWARQPDGGIRFIHDGGNRRPAP